MPGMPNLNSATSADVSGDFPIALMLRTNPVQMTKVTSIAR